MQTDLPATKGIDYLTDSQGRKKAVVIDFAMHGGLLEEFFDVLIARQRLAENDNIPLDAFKEELYAEGELDE